MQTCIPSSRWSRHDPQSVRRSACSCQGEGRLHIWAADRGQSRGLGVGVVSFFRPSGTLGPPCLPTCSVSVTLSMPTISPRLTMSSENSCRRARSHTQSGFSSRSVIPPSSFWRRSQSRPPPPPCGAGLRNCTRLAACSARRSLPRSCSRLVSLISSFSEASGPPSRGRGAASGSWMRIWTRCSPEEG